MNSRNCFENRTYHIYAKNGSTLCNESSEYVQKVKFGAILNENCKNVASATNGLSESQIARSFGIKYPNYQLRYDSFDISCNKMKTI
jgi:hypothetical protein